MRTAAGPKDPKIYGAKATQDLRKDSDASRKDEEAKVQELVERCFMGVKCFFSFCLGSRSWSVEEPKMLPKHTATIMDLSGQKPGASKPFFFI